MSNIKYLRWKVLDYSFNSEPIDSWTLPILRKKSQTGGTLIWQIGFNSETNELIRIHGYDITANNTSGSLQEDHLLVNLNKSNRNIQVQALLQAKKFYIDKYRESYRPYGVLDTSFILPAQLAKKYYDSNDKIHFKEKPSNPGTIDDKDFTNNLVACQVKIDGIRGRIYMDENSNIIIFSRLNNKFGYLDHIKNELDIFFMYLPSGISLDCELYSHDLIFDELASVIKTEKFEHPKSKLVNAYIFDLIIHETTLEDRIKILYNAYQSYINDSHINTYFHIVSTSIANTRSDIYKFHNISVDLGYEGLIIRFFSGSNASKKNIERSWYKGNRNKNLLKHKEFIDEEGIVVGVTSSQGREADLAILIIKDMRSNVFNIRPRGNFENRKLWLHNPELIINKKYTFRYFELTEYNVPRFPIGVGIRDYE